VKTHGKVIKEKDWIFVSQAHSPSLFKRTPLHEAVSQKQKLVAQYLVRNGAAVDALTAQNETPKQLGRRAGISEAELAQYFGKNN
jgi:hypothetical protein